MAKKIKKTTYTLWIQIEEHIEYTDGTEKYKDIKDETATAGRFNKLKDAVESMEKINDIYGTITI